MSNFVDTTNSKVQTEIRRKLLANGYVPLANKDKKCTVKGWSKLAVDEAQIEAWSHKKYRATGLRLDGDMVMVDFDIDDEGVIQDVIVQAISTAPTQQSRERLEEFRNKAPVRYGNGQKEARFCRVAKGEENLGGLASATHCLHGTQPDAVGVVPQRLEIFNGSGRQAGIYGAHTYVNGVVERCYRWKDGVGLANIPHDDLPVLTRADIAHLCDSASAVMASKGWPLFSKSQPKTQKPGVDDERYADLKKLHEGDLIAHWFYRLPGAARAECAKEMLASLLPSYARMYHPWVKVGMALKLADEDSKLFDVWDDWSATADNYDGETEQKWASFSDNFNSGPVNATIRTVIRWAKSNGWDSAIWEHAAAARDSHRLREAFEKLDLARSEEEEEAPELIECEDPTPESVDCDPKAVSDHLTRPGGLVEALIDYGAARSPRETRLPALAGALAAVSALTNRDYIIETPGFHTSPGLQVVLVSETGTGKETARDVVYAVCGLRSSIALADSYASAPALHLALTDKPTQLWANDEFGRYMKVAANATGGGAHDFTLITMAMKLHTMFDKFLPEKVYSQGGNRDRVDHPLLIAMHTTTPKALFDSMDADTVVDGMLGRLLVIQQEGRPQLKLLGSKSSADIPDEVKDKIARQGQYLSAVTLSQLLPAAEGSSESGNTVQKPERWIPGVGQCKFIPISPCDDALRHFELIRQECERRAGVQGVAAALWSRAYEQILRVAGVVAFGQAVWDGNPGGPVITANTLLWARDLVYWSLEHLVPAAEEHASDGARDKLQRAVLNGLNRLSPEFGQDGWVLKTTLLSRVKGRGRSYQDLKDEITALIECGDIEVKIRDDGVPERPEQLRTRR